MIIMIIIAAALFFAGVRLYLFGIRRRGLGAGTAVMAITSSNRMCRITSWWTGQSCGDGIDANYQSTNGLYGLASGGWFGVGLGQSRQKYSWIPEAHNDFIFAIIGEELGPGGHRRRTGPLRHPGCRHLPRGGGPGGPVPPGPCRHHHGVAAGPGDGQHGRGHRA